MLFICSTSKKKNHLFQLFVVQVCSLGAMARENYYMVPTLLKNMDYCSACSLTDKQVYLLVEEVTWR